MDNLTGKALAEYLLLHPEEANSECHWETLCLRDWVRIIKAHPELERFRPQLPAENPYTLLSMEEIIDLHREIQNDLKNSKKCACNVVETNKNGRKENGVLKKIENFSNPAKEIEKTRLIDGRDKTDRRKPAERLSTKQFCCHRKKN